MTDTSFNNPSEPEFWKNVTTKVEEKVQNFSQTLNIAVIGKVSSGKSSLINALLMRNRRNALAIVGAQAGITKKLYIWRLDEKVRLVDSPGLDDVRNENSQITRDFLKSIDVGILVVTGASDASQKRFLEDLQRHCQSVFVVLNKIDEWDRLSPVALEKVINQWKQVLQVEKIYPVCAFGYDIDTPPNIPLDIRGVYQLREDITSFLAKKGKDLLIARHLGQKRRYAIRIIASAVVAVAVGSFIPGSIISVTAIQFTAISSLHYLYKGEVLSVNAISSLMLRFTFISAKGSILLWLGSILPPTVALNLVEALLAINITLGILCTVSFLLEKGERLDQQELLNIKFKSYREQGELALANLDLKHLKDPLYLMKVIDKIL